MGSRDAEHFVVHRESPLSCGLDIMTVRNSGLIHRINVERINGP